MTQPIQRYALLASFFGLFMIGLSWVVDYSFFFIPSGLAISNTLVSWQPSGSYIAAFAVASVNSLAVGVLSIALCTVIGVAIGLIGVHRNPTVRLLYNFYIGAFRNVPILFVILLFYFIGIALPNPGRAIDVLGVAYLSNRGIALPSFAFGAAAGDPLPLALLGSALAALALPIKGGLRIALATVGLFAFAFLAVDVSTPVLGKFGFQGGLTVPVEFAVLTVALSIYYSVEIAEITRGSILSISTGLVDAAQALGLHAVDRFRLVLAPLAFRFGLPSALNTYVVVLKSTSLGVAIGYTELFSTARLSIASSGRVLESLALLGIYYLAICGTISLVANVVTQKLKTRNG